MSTGARRPRAGEQSHPTDSAGPTQSLLALLDHDPVRAEARYRLLRLKLVKFFAWRGCDSAEDLADETVLRVTRNLADGQVVTRTDKPWVYIYGVGLRVYREWVRERRRQPEPLTDDVSDSNPGAPLRAAPLDRLPPHLPRPAPPEARDMLETVYLEGRRDLAAPTGHYAERAQSSRVPPEGGTARLPARLPRSGHRRPVRQAETTIGDLNAMRNRVPATNEPPSNGSASPRDYLLGSVRGRRRRTLERRIFEDDAFFESVLAEEDALLDDHISGRLSEAERARFEGWALRHRGTREAVWAARRLRQALSGSQVAPAVSTRTSGRVWSAGRRTGLVLAIAASLLVALGGWLAFDAWRLRSRIERLQAVVNELRARPPSASPRVEPRIAEPILTFSLRPGLLRSTAHARPLVVAPSAIQVRLQLELREEPGGRTYRAELQTPDGHVLFSESGLAPTKPSPGRFVDLVVPAALLVGGDYILMLSASSRGAPLEEVDSYMFSVAPQP